MTGECVCCHRTLPLNQDGFCPPCTGRLRVEASIGLSRLERYLARYAAFQQWEAHHHPVAEEIAGLA